MAKQTVISMPHRGETLNDVVARLAWEVEQPNGHPLELYLPLIEAIGRRLYGPSSGRQEARIIERLGLPAGTLLGGADHA